MHHSLHTLNDHEKDPQDMRNMGAIKEKMPITYWTFVISTMALAGVPLSSGFLSKDSILAGTLAYYNHNHSFTGLLLVFFGFGAALITAFYMFRLIHMTFHGKPADENIHKHLHESPKTMTFPLIVLASVSTFIVFTIPKFNPFSTEGWFTTLIHAPEKVVIGLGHFNEVVEEGMHHAHHTAMYISIAVAFTGILLATVIYLWKKADPAKMAEKIKPLYLLSLNKFYIDEIYAKLIIHPFLKLCRTVGFIDVEIYDKYVIDGSAKAVKRFSDFAGEQLDYQLLDQTIVDGTGKLTGSAGRFLRRLQTGKLQNYLSYALTGFILLYIIGTIIKAV